VTSNEDVAQNVPLRAAEQISTQIAAIAQMPPATDPVTTQVREQRAFRFKINGAAIELDAVEDIRGDFHRRRGELQWSPGMFYCQLLDTQQRLLAEETLAAPDHVCVVLDPNTTDLDGKPLPARLSPTGPVVFQVRMPKFQDAALMKIYRLSGPPPTGPGLEPTGTLLATIPIAR